MKKFILKLLGIKPTTHIVHVKATELTLAQWRKSPELVTQAQKIFNDGHLRAMIQILKTESPVNYVPANEGTNATQDLETLGDIRGYHRALNNLEAFALPSEENEPLVATFEPEAKES